MAAATFSIVVPTLRRPDTLQACLRTVLIQDVPEMEIIVSNNGGDQTTRDVVAALGDPRLRCVEPPKLLSMAHNFEFGLAQASGAWLVLLGDDDGILPGGLRRGMAILDASGGEALASPTCLYQWPVPGETAARTSLTVPMGRGWSWRSSEAAIRGMLDRDMGFNEAPVTYTGGIVSAALFERIKAVRGSFFQSQIPDCFSAFALCSTTVRYVYCHEPLMVAGISRHSHGKISMSATASQFDRHDNIPFHPAMPVPDDGNLTSSFQAMLYECYLQTAYLRTGPAITNHRAQIVTALAYARWFRGRYEGSGKAARIAAGWARQAAAHHGLDFAAIDRDAARLPLRARLSQRRQTLADFLSRYSVAGGTQAPADVLEACGLAGELWRRRPSRLGSYAGSIARRLSRGRG